MSIVRLPVSVQVWAARIAALGVLMVAALGAMDEEQRLKAIGLPADRLTHALLSYLITLSLIAAFPRTRSWILASATLALGVALEGLQGLGLWAGDAQKGDLAADVAGIALALAPVFVATRRAALNARRATKTAPAPESVPS